VIAAICVVAPFVAVLWIPLYDKRKPEVAGFPFFFWWQLLWVLITAALMGLAYFVVSREDKARKAAVSPASPSAAGGTDTGDADHGDAGDEGVAI
jgi:hypothetical protein